MRLGTRSAFAFLGIGLACIFSGVVVFVGLLAPALLDSFLGPRVAVQPHRFELESEVQVATAGPFAFRIAKLDVAYPPSMRENETGLVGVRYSVTHRYLQFPDSRGIVSTDPPSPQELRELDRRVQFELSSSGFAIEPKTTITKAKEVPLPLRQLWTVTPTAEGSRYLLLKIQEESESRVLRFPFSYTASINGSQVQADPSGFYSLPVTVNTYWGVSRTTSSIAGFLLAGIGALLSYPIVVLLLKRRFGLREKD